MQSKSYLAALIFLFAVAQCNAGLVVLSDHSFEAATSTGSTVQPPEMTFTGSYGDQNSNFYGITDLDSRTGNQAYFMNMGHVTPEVNGFGGNFTLFTHSGVSGTLTAQDIYEVSAWFKASDSNPFLGAGEVNVHLEFKDASNALIFRTDSAGLQPKFTSSTISSSWQQLTHSYTLNNAGHLPNLSQVDRVLGVITLANGSNGGSGVVLVDDYRFTLTTVPEPTSATTFGIGLAILLVRRRRNRRS